MTTSNTPAKLLNNEQAASLLGIRPGTLAIWRISGKSPRFVKIGKLVRYNERDLLEWIESRTHSNTSLTGQQTY